MCQRGHVAGAVLLMAGAGAITQRQGRQHPTAIR
jgi:hypothetical protein